MLFLLIQLLLGQLRNSGAQNFLTEVMQSDFEVISKAQNQLFYCIWTLGSKWIK